MRRITGRGRRARSLIVPQYDPGTLSAGRAWSWYSADVGVSTTGALIDSVSDRSGAGRNLTSAGANRLSLATDAGKAAFRANGASLYARVAAPAGISGNYTLAMVAKFDDNTVANNFCCGIGAVGAGRGVVIGPSAGTVANRAVRHSGISTKEAGAYPTNLYERYIVTYTSAGVPTLYVDGVDKLLAIGIAYNTPTVADFIQIGEAFAAGSRKFYVREFLWFDTNIGAGGVASLDSYLASRWSP